MNLAVSRMSTGELLSAFIVTLLITFSSGEVIEVAIHPLLAVNHQRKRPRLDGRPQMGILRSRSPRWPELSADRINIVIPGIERHGPRSTHRVNRLHNAELVGCIFVGDRDGSIAARREGKRRPRIEPVGVDPCPIGTVPATLPLA